MEVIQKCDLLKWKQACIYNIRSSADKVVVKCSLLVQRVKIYTVTWKPRAPLCTWENKCDLLWARVPSGLARVLRCSASHGYAHVMAGTERPTRSARQTPAEPLMASSFDFYFFSGYEFLILTVQFSLAKILILDVRNWIYTSNNGYFWYQQLLFTSNNVNSWYQQLHFH